MKTQKGVVVPDDVACALQKTESARAAFEAVPPAHQHAYVEAIEEAKKAETR
jgi:uncharacterized protein YdeI (YjbR/CyaY-like superfamily)